MEPRPESVRLVGGFGSASFDLLRIIEDIKFFIHFHIIKFKHFSLYFRLREEQTEGLLFLSESNRLPKEPHVLLRAFPLIGNYFLAVKVV